MVRNAMSATEFYILQYLWTRETPATFSEIMVHFNEEEKKKRSNLCNRLLLEICLLIRCSAVLYPEPLQHICEYSTKDKVLFSVFCCALLAEITGNNSPREVRAATKHESTRA